MKKRGLKFNLIASSLVCIAALILLAGCAAPPTKVIADAQAALEKAKAAGAAIYATEDYQKAEGLLKQALAAQEKYRYFDAETAAKQAIALAKTAEQKGAKAKAQAKLEAQFEVDALGAAIKTTEATIENAKKEGATDKDLAEALAALQEAKNIQAEVKRMMQTESYLGAKEVAIRGQAKADEASSKAFAALQKAKEAAAKVKPLLKNEAAFEIDAAIAAIKNAEALIEKASKTKRAGVAELNAAKAQLAQAKEMLEKAKASLAAEKFEDAKEKGILARELAEKASSSAFNAIAVSKKPSK